MYSRFFVFRALGSSYDVSFRYQRTGTTPTQTRIIAILVSVSDGYDPRPITCENKGNSQLFEKKISFPFPPSTYLSISIFSVLKPPNNVGFPLRIRSLAIYLIFPHVLAGGNVTGTVADEKSVLFINSRRSGNKTFVAKQKKKTRIIIILLVHYIFFFLTHKSNSVKSSNRPVDIEIKKK